jgi:hypothetical protein
LATFLLQRTTLRGAQVQMSTTKRQIRVGPIWVAALMGLWAVALILPAALPH